MCYVEVYNEEVFDLLAATRRPLDLRENVAQQRFYVDGASEHVVSSPEAALQLLQVLTSGHVWVADVLGCTSTCMRLLAMRDSSRRGRLWIWHKSTQFWLCGADNQALLNSPNP